MSKYITLLGISLLSALSIAAVPSTSPTENAADAAVRAKLQLEAAKTELVRARAEQVAKWESSDRYKQMKSDLEEKEIALKNARAGDDTQAKLDASKAFNDAQFKFATANVMAKSEKSDRIAHAEEELTRADKAYNLASARFKGQQELSAAERAAHEAEEAEKNAPEVTMAQLKIVGERYDGKLVKVTNCRFGGADNIWVDQLPGVTVWSNGIQSVIRKNELESWVGFRVGQDDSYGEMFAVKADFADILLAMKRGEKLSLYGRVVRLRQAGWYGIVCYRIEKADTKEAEKD